MAERKGDILNPGGYAPDPKFKEAVQNFRDDHKKLAQTLIESAEKGEPIPRAAILTLDRAEKLYVEAAAPGPKVAAFQRAGLDQGIGNNGGRSLSAQLKFALAPQGHEDTRETGIVYTAPTR